MQYKTYPNHIGHWNPESPEYVQSDREEHSLKEHIKGYNQIVDDLRTNLEMQAKVYDMIDNLDRPYLRGARGIHRNVYDQVQDYSNPVGHTQTHPEAESRHAFKGDANEHRWISNTAFHPKFTPMSNMVEWEQGRDNRPVNDHYNADKGFKFDVPVPYQERVPHVADRLGYPEQLGSPLERLLRMDADDYHPAYLNQPFVQTPPAGVDASLNFQEGEVVYENVRINEWNKFWMFSGISTGLFCGCWVPYQQLVKSKIPWKSQLEGIPMWQYFDQSPYSFDTYGATSVLFVPLFTLSWLTWIKFIHTMYKPYAVRMQYNKDQELLFVSYTSIWGD